MSGGAFLVGDHDLHGLVDGQLDPSRRADVLRRAMASPEQRAVFERWQQQADLIRAAFGGVEHEPLPKSLDLKPFSPVEPFPAAPREPAKTESGAHRLVATAATIFCVAAGLVGAWVVAGMPVSGDVRPVIEIDADPMHRLLAMLADEARDDSAAGAGLPAGAAIPDLSALGWRFVGAEPSAGAHQVEAGRALVIRYRDPAGDGLVVGTMRSTGPDRDAVTRNDTVWWRAGGTYTAVVGTKPGIRLAAVAAALQAPSPVTRPEMPASP